MRYELTLECPYTTHALASQCRVHISVMVAGSDPIIRHVNTYNYPSTSNTENFPEIPGNNNFSKNLRNKIENFPFSLT